MKSWGDTKPSKLLEELKRHKAPDFRCQRLVVANICLMLRVHLFVVSMMPNCRISSGDGLEMKKIFRNQSAIRSEPREERRCSYQVKPEILKQRWDKEKDPLCDIA